MGQKQLFGAVPPELQSDLDDLKAAVGDEATKVAALEAQVNTQMSPADVENVRAQIRSSATSLRAIFNPPAPPAPPA